MMQIPDVAVAHRIGIQGAPKSRTELNQKNRIIKALGSVTHIPRVREEPHLKYYRYLTEHLGFPFRAYFPKPMNVEEEDEFCCIVLMLLDPAKHVADGLDGVFCKTRKGTYEVNLPLIDLYLPEDGFRFQLIDDYWFWLWNWR